LLQDSDVPRLEVEILQHPQLVHRQGSLRCQHRGHGLLLGYARAAVRLAALAPLAHHVQLKVAVCGRQGRLRRARRSGGLHFEGLSGEIRLRGPRARG